MSKYEVIRGADSEIEFQGLYGKYVWGLFIGLAVTLLLGLILFILLPSPTLAGSITLASAATVVYFAFHWNKKYGRWGLEQKKVKQMLPSYVIMEKPFTLIRKKHG